MENSESPLRRIAIPVTLGTVICIFAGIQFSNHFASPRYRQILSRYGGEAEKTYIVLTKTEVQNDLQLSPNQLAQIKTVHGLDAKEIPAVSNLLDQASQMNKLNRRRLVGQVSEVINKQRLDGYYGDLTANQSNRLRTIMFRVCGLGVLLKSHHLKTTLAVSEEQIEKLEHIATNYGPDLSLLY